MSDTDATKTEADRIDALEAQLVELKIQQLMTAREDHERRIRTLETASTELMTLKQLVLGGGALSALNLLVLVAHFVIGK